MIISYICVLILVILFVMTTIDIITYGFDAMSQKRNLMMDPNMFNKDTHDYIVLDYVKTNTREEEPYNVFLCEGFTATVFVLVGICVLMLGLEYGITAALIYYNIYTDGTTDYSIDINKSIKYFGIIAVALCGALSLSGVYNSYFIKDTQNAMYGIQNTMTNITGLIYDNLTTDQIYLNALVNNNTPTLIHQFSETIQKGIQNNDTTEAEKMIFTASIFSYLTTAIPVTDPNYKTVLSIFDYDNIEAQDIDPTKYLYYNNYNINILNLYPELIQIINDGLTSFKGKSISTEYDAFKDDNNIDPFFGSKNDLLKSQFTHNIQTKLDLVTEYITQLSVDGIYQGKDNLLIYLIIAAIVSFVFMVFVIFALYNFQMIPENVRNNFVIAAKFIISMFRAFFHHISEFIKKIKKRIMDSIKSSAS